MSIATTTTAKPPAAAPAAPAPPALDPTNLEVQLATLAVQSNPDAALATAQATLARAAAAFTATTPANYPGGVDLTMLRDRRKAWVAAAARAALLNAAKAGTKPDWAQALAAAETDVATQIVRRRAGSPDAAALIAGRVSSALAADQTELAALQAETDPSPASAFHEGGRTKWERRAVLEARIPARAKAVASFAAEFSKRVAVVITANQSVLETGLLEAGLVTGKFGRSPRAKALEGQLADVKQQRALISQVLTKIAPGGIAQTLDAQAAGLNKQIDAAHAAHGTQIEASIQAAIAGAAGGDINAWQKLALAVATNASAFPADVTTTLLAVGSDAMVAADPVTFSTAYAGGYRGRDDAARDF